MKQFIAKLLRENILNEEVSGVVYHGTPNDVQELSLDFVKGGERVRYGWGLYFTSLKHKAANDYGKGGHLFSANVSNLKLLNLDHHNGDRVTSEFIAMADRKLGNKDEIVNDLKSLNSEIINEIIDYFGLDAIMKDPKIIITQIEDNLANVRNNNDYEMYIKTIESVDSILEQYHTIDDIDNYYLSLLKKGVGELFYNVNKMIMGEHHESHTKRLAMFYKSLGYDGFVHGDEYVLFNLGNVKITKLY